MEVPEWLKIGGIIITWDVVRMFIQAYINKRILKKDFDDIDKALDDIEEDIEEQNGNSNT